MKNYFKVQTPGGAVMLRGDRAEESTDGGLVLLHPISNPFGGPDWERSVYLPPGAWQSYAAAVALVP